MNKDNKAATVYKVVKSKRGKATKTAGSPITYLFKGVPLYFRIRPRISAANRSAWVRSVRASDSTMRPAIP